MSSSEYVIARERYSPQFWQEILPLARKNWAASPSFEPGIPADPDEERYAAADRANRCLCLTARVSGKLVGYAVFFVGNSTHHKTILCGFGDSFYVEPEHQGSPIASRLIREAEQIMLEAGVKRIGWVVDMGSRVHQLLNALDYEDDEIVVEKLLCAS